MEHSSEYNASFKRLISRHEKIIFSVCFFYATSEVPFEDLRQEVLISLFKSYQSFRHDSSESTWVYKVAINTCIFALRKLSSKIKLSAVDELPLTNYSDNDDNLKENLEWLYHTISQLNPIDKALILMWLDELSYDDIASNMGIPRNTVASRLYIIKEKLSSKKQEL